MDLLYSAFSLPFVFVILVWSSAACVPNSQSRGTAEGESELANDKDKKGEIKKEMNSVGHPNACGGATIPGEP